MNSARLRSGFSNHSDQRSSLSLGPGTSGEVLHPDRGNAGTGWRGATALKGFGEVSVVSPLRPLRPERVPTSLDTEERLARLFHVPHCPRMIVLVRSCLSSLAHAIVRQLERRRIERRTNPHALGDGRSGCAGPILFLTPYLTPYIAVAPGFRRTGSLCVSKGLNTPRPFASTAEHPNDELENR
jgi:hypothetical protein